jgi:ubiquinone/menaquinone biosynthesis C-methylase UbiE
MSLAARIAEQSRLPRGFVGRLLSWVMSFETRQANATAIELLALAPTDRVLEIGFGHGRTLDRLLAAVPDGRVTGIDASQDAVRWANLRHAHAARVARLQLLCGDAAQLPVAGESFDKVLTVHTIYFWKDPSRQLRELRRVLRPGGSLVLGFFEVAHSRRLPPHIYSFRSAAEIALLAQRAGFSDVTVHPPGPSSSSVRFVRALA